MAQQALSLVGDQDQGFSLDTLDPAARAVVQEATMHIRERADRIARDFWETGRELLRVKRVLDHGQFLAWVAQDLPFHQDTAAHYMNVAERFSPLSDSERSEFADRALYLLAARPVPEEVRTKAIALAQQGIRITSTVAKRLIAEGGGARVATVLDDGGDEARCIVPDQSGTLSDDALGMLASMVTEELAAGAVADDLADDMIDLLEARTPAATPLAPHQLLHSSATTEWYTPPDALDLVREVLGVIDLDPASSEGANRQVGARRYYTVEQDGLSQPWQADTIFCNPPYGRRDGRSLAGLFADRLRTAYAAGQLGAAILLVSANTGTSWFQPLFAYPVCFVAERIAFLDQQLQQQGGPTVENAFVYLGPDDARFAAVFGRIGSVVRRLEPGGGVS